MVCFSVAVLHRTQRFRSSCLRGNCAAVVGATTVLYHILPLYHTEPPHPPHPPHSLDRTVWIYVHVHALVRSDLPSGFYWPGLADWSSFLALDEAMAFWDLATRQHTARAGAGGPVRTGGKVFGAMKIHWLTLEGGEVLGLRCRIGLRDSRIPVWGGLRSPEDPHSSSFFSFPRQNGCPQGHYKTEGYHRFHLQVCGGAER